MPQDYSAVRHHLRGRAMSLETRIREEICTVGASLYQRGYTVGAAGNISARLDDGWLITPTDACLGRLDPAELAKVDPPAIRFRAASLPRPWRCTRASTKADPPRAAWCIRIRRTRWR